MNVRSCEYLVLVIPNIRANFFVSRNSTFCQFCCMILRESMSNPVESFFKVQSLKLLWSDIALHQSIIYKASESLNDALTEVNFFNKSDTKKKFGDGDART